MRLSVRLFSPFTSLLKHRIPASMRVSPFLLTIAAALSASRVLGIVLNASLPPAAAREPAKRQIHNADYSNGNGPPGVIAAPDDTAATSTSSAKDAQSTSTSKSKASRSIDTAYEDSGLKNMPHIDAFRFRRNRPDSVSMGQTNYLPLNSPSHLQRRVSAEPYVVKRNVISGYEIPGTHVGHPFPKVVNPSYQDLSSEDQEAIETNNEAPRFRRWTKRDSAAMEAYHYLTRRP